jgi:hypothetical protein
VRRELLALRGGPFNGYRTHRVRRIKSRLRRAELAQQRLCINGASHGPATKGVRCEACAEVHKRTA